MPPVTGATVANVPVTPKPTDTADTVDPVVPETKPAMPGPWAAGTPGTVNVNVGRADSEFEPSAATPIAPSASSPPSLQVSTRLPVDKLTQIGATAGGRAFWLDGGALEGMEVRARQIVNPDSLPGTELSMRLTEDASKALSDKFKANAFAGASTVPFQVEHAEFKDGATRLDAKDPYRPMNDSGNVMTNKVEVPGKYTVEFLPTGSASQAYRDRLRVRVFGATDAERKTNFDAATKALGLEPLFADADATQIEKTKRLELLHVVAPKAEEELGPKLAGLTVDEMNTALSAAGIDAARLAKATVKEVFPGHVTLVDPALGESYQKAGVRGLMVGVGQLDSIARILGSDGLMSTNERYGRGIHRPGASSTSDERTGGSNYAFTRLLTTHAFNNDAPIGNSFAAGQAQLVTTGAPLTELLSRTDWHAYPSDCFGNNVSRSEVTKGLVTSSQAVTYIGNEQCSYSDRKVVDKLVAAIEATPSWGGTTGPSTNFAFGNEAMFRSGVRASTFTHAIVQSEDKKAELITLLKAQGISKIGDKSLEQAIVVAQNWKQAAPLLGVTP